MWCASYISNPYLVYGVKSRVFKIKKNLQPQQDKNRKQTPTCSIFTNLSYGVEIYKYHTMCNKIIEWCSLQVFWESSPYCIYARFYSFKRNNTTTCLDHFWAKISWIIFWKKEFFSQKSEFKPKQVFMTCLYNTLKLIFQYITILFRLCLYLLSI